MEGLWDSGIGLPEKKKACAGEKENEFYLRNVFLVVTGRFAGSLGIDLLCTGKATSISICPFRKNF